MLSEASFIAAARKLTPVQGSVQGKVELSIANQDLREIRKAQGTLFSSQSDSYLSRVSIVSIVKSN